MEENKEDITYAKAIAELESIVAHMQADDCDIDMLTVYTSRALALLKTCKEKLTKTDEELQKILKEL